MLVAFIFALAGTADGTGPRAALALAALFAAASGIFSMARTGSDRASPPERRQAGLSGGAPAMRSIRAWRSTSELASFRCAMSISTPLAPTAPWPPCVVRSSSSVVRAAHSSSSALGENTSLASAICDGWIAHLPSKPSALARSAEAR